VSAPQSKVSSSGWLSFQHMRMDFDLFCQDNVQEEWVSGSERAEALPAKSKKEEER
jgi:hypothetical protein